MHLLNWIWRNIESGRIESCKITFIFFGAIPVHLIGLGFGVIGVVQRKRKKLFSILGLIFNAAAVFLIIFFVALVFAALVDAIR